MIKSVLPFPVKMLCSPLFFHLYFNFKSQNQMLGYLSNIFSFYLFYHHWVIETTGSSSARETMADTTARHVLCLHGGEMVVVECVSVVEATHFTRMNPHASLLMVLSAARRPSPLTLCPSGHLLSGRLTGLRPA